VEYVQNEGFVAHFNGKVGSLHFVKRRDNTFSCDLPVRAVMETTVADRKKMYSKAEVQRARGVRDLKRKLTGASDRELNEFISSGVALSCPFTPEDVRRAATIYGPDISCLRGKMASPGPDRPLVVSVNHGEQRIQELHMDIFEVLGVSFLLSVMSPMRYTFATCLPGQRTAAHDSVQGICGPRDTLAVSVNAVAPGTHVARVERRNPAL
jgi:hypothetical protein